MKCQNPVCDSERTIVTHTVKEGGIVIRYRRCLDCNFRFKTDERPVTLIGEKDDSEK